MTSPSQNTRRARHPQNVNSDRINAANEEIARRRAAREAEAERLSLLSQEERDQEEQVRIQSIREQHDRASRWAAEHLTNSNPIPNPYNRLHDQQQSRRRGGKPKKSKKRNNKTKRKSQKKH